MTKEDLISARLWFAATAVAASEMHEEDPERVELERESEVVWQDIRDVLLRDHDAPLYQTLKAGDYERGPEGRVGLLGGVSPDPRESFPLGQSLVCARLQHYPSRQALPYALYLETHEALGLAKGLRSTGRGDWWAQELIQTCSEIAQGLEEQESQIKSDTPDGKARNNKIRTVRKEANRLARQAIRSSAVELPADAYERGSGRDALRADLGDFYDALVELTSATSPLGQAATMFLQSRTLMALAGQSPQTDSDERALFENWLAWRTSYWLRPRRPRGGADSDEDPTHQGPELALGVLFDPDAKEVLDDDDRLVWETCFDPSDDPESGERYTAHRQRLLNAERADRGLPSLSEDKFKEAVQEAAWSYGIALARKIIRDDEDVLWPWETESHPVAITVAVDVVPGPDVLTRSGIAVVSAYVPVSEGDKIKVVPVLIGLVPFSQGDDLENGLRRVSANVPAAHLVVADGHPHLWSPDRVRRLLGHGNLTWHYEHVFRQNSWRAPWQYDLDRLEEGGRKADRGFLARLRWISTAEKRGGATKLWKALQRAFGDDRVSLESLKSTANGPWLDGRPGARTFLHDYAEAATEVYRGPFSTLGSETRANLRRSPVGDTIVWTTHRCQRPDVGSLDRTVAVVRGALLGHLWATDAVHTRDGYPIDPTSFGLDPAAVVARAA